MPNYSGVWSLPAQMQAIEDQTWPQGPGAPTSVGADAGDAQADVTFTAPTFTGVPAGITGYLATSSGGQTSTGASSPLTVTGLTNGTAYTFVVQATNSVGYGASATTGSVSPAAAVALFGSINSNGAGSYIGIEKINLSTTGNSTDWGDLTVSRNGSGSFSSTTRGLWAGGGNTNVIDYITFASQGNAVDFGNVTDNSASGVAGVSNNTRGIVNRNDDMFYVTIASTGNTALFGTLTVVRLGGSACASTTRGVFAGGSSGQQTADYVTIASTGNATSFGTITGFYREGGAGMISSGTRGIFGGGYSSNVGGATNAMRYITIATTGSNTDFGDLLFTSYNVGSAGSKVRGIFAGGTAAGSLTNIIQYITIANTGNATDFGDLTTNEATFISGCSNSHGGL